MSVPTEVEAGQQNHANDMPNPDASTTAQHNERLFAMPEVPGIDNATQKNRNRRGRP